MYLSNKTYFIYLLLKHKKVGNKNIKLGDWTCMQQNNQFVLSIEELSMNQLKAFAQAKTGR